MLGDNEIVHWDDNDLPDLVNQDILTAEGYSVRLWALDFVNPKNIGKYEWLSHLGLTLQNTGPFSVRCIYAVGHFQVRINLAMIKKTFASINVNLELGAYTVVAPFNEIYTENQPTRIEENEVIQEENETSVQGKYDFVDTA